MKTKELATVRLSRLFERRVVKIIVVDKTKEKRFRVGVATFGRRTGSHGGIQWVFVHCRHLWGKLEHLSVGFSVRIHLGCSTSFPVARMYFSSWIREDSFLMDKSLPCF